MMGFSKENADNSPLLSSSTIIHVNQENSNGPWEGTELYPYRQIHQAITVAKPYDTILVWDGLYHECITIKKPIHIIGSDQTIIDGSYQDTILSIKSDNVAIEHLIIQHSNGFSNSAGIHINNVSNTSISNCIIHHTKNALLITNSTNIHLEENWFFHNGNAISIYYSDQIMIQTCDFAFNAIALVGDTVQFIHLTQSVFHNNGISAFFYQGRTIQITLCNITDNSVNKGGLFLLKSSHFTISNVTLHHNGDGISVTDCNNLTIKDSSLCYNTHYALSLRGNSYNIVVSNCNLSDNLRSAIYIEENNSCQINYCNILRNYLYSIHCQNSRCDAKMNYWGSSFGPFHPVMFITNKIRGMRSYSEWYPWVESPIIDAGIKTDSIPSARYNHTYDEVIPVPLNGTDTDGDAAPDWWEENYGYSIDIWNDHQHLDPDHDALSNLQECYLDSLGADPFHKDIFLEIDWMTCPDNENNKPDTAWLQPIIESFSKKNITLHIDLGSLGGGEEIPYQCMNMMKYTGMENIYWDYFLHNDLQNPRKGLFHYGIICYFCPDINFPFMGWDSLDAFAISAQWLKDQYPFYDRQQLIAGGIIHHLGHTLGLIVDSHKGIDNIDTTYVPSFQWMRYSSYRSCMNYFYKFRLFTFSDGLNGPYDFDDWSQMNFSFFQKSNFHANL